MLAVEAGVEAEAPSVAELDPGEVGVRRVEQVVVLARHDHRGYAQGSARAPIDPVRPERRQLLGRRIAPPARGRSSIRIVTIRSEPGISAETDTRSSGASIGSRC